MTSQLAVDALGNAVALRGQVDVVVHSDRGSQGGFHRSSQHLDRGGVGHGYSGLEQEDQRRSRGLASAVAC
jgi:hypothetical protein